MFSSSDLSATDPDTWYCSRSDLLVDTERGLKTVENELFKLGIRVLRELE